MLIQWVFLVVVATQSLHAFMPPVSHQSNDSHAIILDSVNDGVFTVEGEWLLQVIKSVNFDDFESLQYFQRVLINSGVIDALREAGIQEGDTASIYGIEFDFKE